MKFGSNYRTNFLYNFSFLLWANIFFLLFRVRGIHMLTVSWKIHIFMFFCLDLGWQSLKINYSFHYRERSQFRRCEFTIPISVRSLCARAVKNSKYIDRCITVENINLPICIVKILRSTTQVNGERVITPACYFQMSLSVFNSCGCTIHEIKNHNKYHTCAKPQRKSITWSNSNNSMFH